MNHNIKFHKPESPAFIPGEIWFACSGSGNQVEVVSIRRWGTEKWDADVTYRWLENGEYKTNTKDCWNFQVRYFHQADQNL
jgi:hypothetical protein